jgi:hypothetical protein
VVEVRAQRASKPRERYLLALTAVPFVVAALLPGSVLPHGSGGDQVSRFEDTRIVESSGLVVVGESLVTTNDSGDSGRLFTVDPHSGSTIRVTEWSDDPTDVEALAPAGDGSVWVGDIGDNAGERTSVSVTRVSVVGVEPQMPSYELVYPEGPRDAESLIADPATGRLYVVSKGVLGGTLYAAPERLSAGKPNRLEEVAPVLGIATDAAFFPDGRHLIVRSYTEAAVYSWPDLTEVGRFGLPDQQQGEGIAVSVDGTIYASSEGLHAPVLRIALPAAVQRAMEPAPPSASLTPTPTPSATPPPGTREGRELPEREAGPRSAWGWALGGILGLGIVVVLGRALRPR